MFVLRQQHFDAFAADAKTRFMDDMVADLQQRFPDECEKMGEPALRARITDGTARAAKYGIVADRDVATFLRYTFGIRADFDTAPETKWAQTILARKNIAAANRLEQIKEEARRQRMDAAAAAAEAACAAEAAANAKAMAFIPGDA